MVLDHSGHFFRHAATGETARVLATLHLPRELYGAEAFEGLAENVCFNCVSESQRREFMDLPQVLGVVRNGIAVERFAPAGRKSRIICCGWGEFARKRLRIWRLRRRAGGDADCAGRTGVSICVARGSIGSAR